MSWLFGSILSIRDLTNVKPPFPLAEHRCPSACVGVYCSEFLRQMGRLRLCRKGDQYIYLVMDDLGGLGRFWPEADAEATDLDTAKYIIPVCVSEDVLEDVAPEIRRRHDLQMRNFLPRSSIL